jgi:hypothetical protein
LVGAKNAGGTESPNSTEAMNDAGIARIVDSEEEEQVVSQVQNYPRNDADQEGVPAAARYQIHP